MLVALPIRGYSVSVRCKIPEPSREPRGRKNAHPPPTKCTTSIVSPASSTVSDHANRETMSRFRSTATASSSKPSLRIRSPTEIGDASEQGSPFSVTTTTSAPPPTALAPLGIRALYAAANGVPGDARQARLGPDRPTVKAAGISWQHSVGKRYNRVSRWRPFGPLSRGSAGSLTVRTPLAPVQPVRRGLPVHIDEPRARSASGGEGASTNEPRHGRTG